MYNQDWKYYTIDSRERQLSTFHFPFSNLSKEVFMKVIHLTSGGDVGGAKTHILSLLRGLSRTEQADMVCFTGGAFAEEAKACGIRTTVLEGPVHKTVKALKTMIRDGGYEIIHSHGARANFYGAMLGRRLHLPTVTTVHSDPKLDYLGKPLHDLVYGNVNRRALRRIDYQIGVSDVMAELLISRGFDAQRVYTLYNGVDFTPRGYVIERKDYLRSLSVDFDEQTVIFGVAARLSPVKDITTLVRAFALACETQPNIRLLIAGDGEQAQELRHLAQTSCPAGSVHFIGWVEDTDSFYNALDVNLLTSISETFPYALTEGARYRCATVSSRVGGVPYLIDDGINGLIFPPQDVQKLADCMVLLAGDRLLRERFGEKLYEKTKAKFSVEATVERQKEIYRSVLRRQERRGRKRDGVMICGAYGRHNAGDDGILRAMTQALRQQDPELPICVISRSPVETEMQFRVKAYHTFDVIGWLRGMRKTALYISGGGSLIQDATSARSLLYYLYHLREAKRLGNRVMMYGCGVGPVQREKSRRLAGRILDRFVDCAALRDNGSVRELASLGVTKPEIHLTADPALLLPVPDPDAEAACLHALGFSPGRTYFMVALRPWEGVEEKLPLLAQEISRAAKEYDAEAVLFALEPGRDLPLLERLAPMLGCYSRVIAAPERWEALLSVIRRMRAVLSMRLHPLIFAAGQGIPVAGIVYDPKVQGFLDDLGCDAYCTVAELDAQTVRRLLDSALHEEMAPRSKTDALRARAEQNAALARKLLEGAAQP